MDPEEELLEVVLALLVPVALVEADHHPAHAGAEQRPRADGRDAPVPGHLLDGGPAEEGELEFVELVEIGALEVLEHKGRGVVLEIRGAIAAKIDKGVKIQKICFEIQNFRLSS